MKLFESVDLVADGQSAAGSIVHHDGVTIIDDAERHSAVTKLQRRKIDLPGFGNINRRLDMATGASGVSGVEFAPVLGIFLSFVAPMRRRGRLGVRKSWQQRKAEEENEGFAS